MSRQISPAFATARVRTQWKAGNSGRPPGTRTKLGLLFIHVLCEDFEAHDVEVLRRVREEDPSTYIRTIASILPRELEIKRPFAELSDDELTRAIEVIRLALSSAPTLPAIPQHGSPPEKMANGRCQRGDPMLALTVDTAPAETATPVGDWPGRRSRGGTQGCDPCMASAADSRDRDPQGQGPRQEVAEVGPVGETRPGCLPRLGSWSAPIWPALAMSCKVADPCGRGTKANG